jgi:hypothetical protein
MFTHTVQHQRRVYFTLGAKLLGNNKYETWAEHVKHTIMFFCELYRFNRYIGGISWKYHNIRLQLYRFSLLQMCSGAVSMCYSFN